MARRLRLRCHRSNHTLCGLQTLVSLLFYWISVVSSEVSVPEQVDAVLGKNITLGCWVEVAANLTLTQSSWERRLPSGTVTLAVFNPEFGISISPEYAHRVSFVNPSEGDASILLEGVGFGDIGSYTCKVATFPLGNSQASTTVNILVEPKVEVQPGPSVLLDGANETVVATCVAERGRPAAEVFWESELELQGHSEGQREDQPNGTTTSQVTYLWRPTRHAQGHAVTCVVRHPALPYEIRRPFTLNVQFAPDVRVVGYNSNWFSGQEGMKLDCLVNANPAPYSFTWTRVKGSLPEGVLQVNTSLLFSRPLERNDSGLYRCEVRNTIGMRYQDKHIWVQDPPPTTALPTTSAAAAVPGGSDTTGTAPDHRQAHFSSPTQGSPAAPAGQGSEGHLGTIVGGAVGGILILALLLGLAGVCYMRQRRTFRGDYYTKQYLGPSDMQKDNQLDVLQPHELQVYSSGGSGDGSGSGDSGKGSQDLKPKPIPGDLIYDYASDRKDREEWGGDPLHHQTPRAITITRDGGYYSNEQHLNHHHHHHPQGNQQAYPQQPQQPQPQPPHHHLHSSSSSSTPPIHTHTTSGGGGLNGSPYLPEDCYVDNGTESDYVSHMDGSVISRREWYV
ncbi:nectin-3-like protein [Engraulis encrasicolus]|uniref:nectin-3-like protein n=1 Tax=Engraulis encrasicolus TaxID=184585 RepID=UPI002FD2F2E7